MSNSLKQSIKQRLRSVAKERDLTFDEIWQTLSGNARLFLCRYPVNMKKSFEGLSAIVEELFPGELLTGAFFIFLNRRKDHIKVLFWDNDGLVIFLNDLKRSFFMELERRIKA